MMKLIKRLVSRLFVNAMWRDYLAGGGRLVLTDAAGDRYEWLPDYGAWEPITIER